LGGRSWEDVEKAGAGLPKRAMASRNKPVDNTFNKYLLSVENPGFRKEDGSAKTSHPCPIRG